MPALDDPEAEMQYTLMLLEVQDRMRVVHGRIVEQLAGTAPSQQRFDYEYGNDEF